MAETLKKIQDLIAQNRILEKRNEELKNIIDINLSQKQFLPTTTIPISDVIGKSEIESLVFKFYSTYKIPTSLCNINAEILFSIGWKKIFTLPTGLNKNSTCISEILKVHQKNGFDNKFITYTCPYGFNAISFPIEIHREYTATLVFNQFIYKESPLSYDSVKKLADKFETDEKTMLQMLSEIPVFTKDEIKNIVNQGLLLAEMISFVGNKNFEFYKKFRQQTDTETLLNALKRKISEQEDIIKSLLTSITEHLKDIDENTVRKSTLKKETKKLLGKLDHTEYILNSILTSSPLGICFLKNNIITFSNDQMHQITGFTTRELLGLPVKHLISNIDSYNEIINSESTINLGKVSFLVNIICKSGELTETIGFLNPILPGKKSEGFTLGLINLKQFNNLFKNPRLKNKILGDLQAETKLNPDWSSFKILIAEDEEMNYLYLNKILQPTQVKIEWAQNGKEAIELFSKNLDINLVLMDIKMPVMNGIDATRILRTINPKVPIIAQTAYVQENTKEAIFEAGCNDFLAKPIDIVYLINVLKKYLKSNT